MNKIASVCQTITVTGDEVVNRMYTKKFLVPHLKIKLLCVVTYNQQ